MLAERLAERTRVLEEDVDPDPRVRAGDAGHVAQRPARRRERFVALDATASGLVDEHVRERVRQVARDRDEAVVRLWVDGDRRCAEARDEPVHGAVPGRVGLRERRQEPGSPFEQLRAGANSVTPERELVRAEPRATSQTAVFVEPTSVTVQLSGPASSAAAT